MHEFWTEELADRVIARHDAPYVVSDWKTPSGRIHVGSLMGVILHDAVARNIRSRGQVVRYVYGFDDFDPLNKLPNYLNQDLYRQYLGQPLVDIPAPDETGAPQSEVTETNNYARYFGDTFENVYRSLGVNSETVFGSKLYRSGQFNHAIRVALDHASEIRAAYEDVVLHQSADRKGNAVSDKFPIDVRCQRCGRISTTRATDWDGEKVTYDCSNGVVPAVDGCGNHGSAGPFDGGAKLPWKVEWAAKWWLFESDIEGAGKDHYTKGGSRDVSTEIFRRVYQSVKPENSHHLPQLPEDLFYEWFNLGGKKMSTSKGVGASAEEVSQLIPGELLRFLILRKRPQTAVDFEPNSEAIAQLFDEYDRVLAAANASAESHESEIMRAALIEEKELPTYVMRFRKLIQLVQLLRPDDLHIEAAAIEEKGANLTPAETHELTRRIEFARKTASRSADRIEVQLELPTIELTSSQRTYLGTLGELVTTADWTAEALQAAVHTAKKTVKIEPKLAFQAIYRAFLNLDFGPQAGQMLAGLDRIFVEQRLTEASRGIK